MISLITGIIAIFIMYKCCENLSFKATWGIYTIYHTLCACINSGFSYFFMALVIYALIDLVVVFIYYKIFERSNYSFWKFFGLSILIELAVVFALILVATVISMNFGNNGILRNV